jgi:hypothetical protein
MKVKGVFRDYANAPKNNNATDASVHAIKAHTGSRGIAILVLNFGTRWK